MTPLLALTTGVLKLGRPSMGICRGVAWSAEKPGVRLGVETGRGREALGVADGRGLLANGVPGELKFPRLIRMEGQ